MVKISQDSLVCNLREVLTRLRNNHYPHIPNPLNCKKRASVACIIRIRPGQDVDLNKHQTHIPTDTDSEQLESFFSKNWVLSGDPEILFIRRAARKGDRWTSQVALPGGKRDAADVDDQATSIRETREEVGIDLTSPSVLAIGNLPERIITTEWGTVPLMVLCPFVYLILDSKGPLLKLQPTEIASTHWVSIRALTAPHLWTYKAADASDRFAKRGGTLLRYFFRIMVGQMLFGAIRLLPSESLDSNVTTPEPRLTNTTSDIRRLKTNTYIRLFGTSLPQEEPEKPLLLWGLTHGIVLDLLRLMPSSEALSSWKWPTFSSPDARLIIWLISLRFRRRKFSGVTNAPRGPFMVIEEGFASDDTPEIRREIHQVTQKLTETRPALQSTETRSIEQHSAVHYMLHGYFALIQKGLALSIAFRIGLFLALVSLAIKRTR